MTRYIVRRVRTAHCKLGPLRCEKCKEMDVGRICLLDIAPPDQGLVQRRVIEVEIDGESTWREFDIVKAFESAETAQAYARENGIRDVQLE